MKKIKQSFNLILTLAVMLMMAQTAWATDETKTFVNSTIQNGSTGQVTYNAELLFSAVGNETVRKDGDGIVNFLPQWNEVGTVRFYPHISGKVKSIVFSSAYTGTANGYMKIGKGSTWTNSVSETMTGNNPWTSISFTNSNGIQLDNEDDYLEIKLFCPNGGGFFSKGSITVTFEPTASTLTHTHNFSYSKNGSTLIATCAHDDGMDCTLASDNWQISTTLTPPTNATYAPNVSHPATLSNIAGFTTETGATAGDITYVNNTINANLGTSSPHDVGAYTASVTITAGGTDYTLTTSYRVGTFCGININYPQFTTDKDGNYAIDGETVTLTFTSKFGETLTGVTATGATSGSDITLTTAGANTYTFTMPAEGVNIGATFIAPDANHFAQDGDAYTIKTDNGWNWFCFAVNYGLASDGFSGQTVKLDSDISSSEMVGKSDHPFKGTFDGQGNTLTFNLTASEGYSAPFHYTDGATISNLHVTGLIEGNDISPLAGLVGKATGNITISNCHVSTQISTTVSISAWHGGVIAYWDDSNVECTITGCVYDGLIYNPSEANSTSYCFGFLGNSYGSNMDIIFTDCLFAPAEYTNDKKALREDYGSRTFVYPKSGLIFHVTNCYYTRNLGKRQGRPATTATTAPANLGSLLTDRELVDGYENGLFFNSKYYTPIYSDVVVEYPYDDDEERACVTINGEGNNLVGVNIKEDVEKVSSVTYNRTFSQGVAATVILPFNYTCNDNEGGKFYGFKEVTYDYDQHIWVCTMKEPGEEGANNVTSLTANTPYLFMPSDTKMKFPNIENMTNGVVTLLPTTVNEGLYGGATTDYDWNFYGTYKGKTWTEVSKDYGFAAYGGTAIHGEEVVAGQFVRFATGAFIKPMRCYLSYVGTSAPAPAKGITCSGGDDMPQSITVRLVNRNGVTTAIGELNTETGELTFDGWYTMDGARLNGKPSKSGVYINNGKKIVIP